jgi:hypothetical protein
MVSLADYVLVNSFVVCSDWLNWNTGWWRGTDTTGGHRKWGYILWDNDATFDFYINYTNVPSTQYDALICGPQTQNANYYSDPLLHLDVLSKLLTNPSFNTWYINHAIDLSNTVFSCDNMLHQLDSIVTLLTPEMPGQCARWSGNFADWQTNVQTLRNFIINRCNYLSTTGFINCYSLTGPYNVVLNVDPPGAGSIQLNSLTLNSFPWTGTYFGNITTSLSANAGSAAYAFTNWTTLGQLLNPSLFNATVTANITNSDTITAHFSIVTGIGNDAGIENSVNVYPTVFSDETTVEYTLTERAPVSIKLLSLLGTEVAQIKTPEEFLSRGSYSVKLNLSGSGLNSGIYFLKFTAGNFSKTIKLVYSPR